MSNIEKFYHYLSIARANDSVDPLNEAALGVFESNGDLLEAELTRKSINRRKNHPEYTYERLNIEAAKDSIRAGVTVLTSPGSQGRYYQEQALSELNIFRK